MSSRDIQDLFAGAEAEIAALERQARLLAEVTQGFTGSLNIDETLDIAIERFMVYLDAEAASIFLLENGDTELVCRECAGPVDITGLRLDANQGIVGKTIRERAAQMVRDVAKDPDFAAAVDAGTGFVTRSILCAPLMVQETCVGALELINKRSGDGLFSARDMHLVTVIASSAALAIHNARMADALIEQERVRKELELAREIQLDLLPAPANDDFPVTGVNLPALEVSGDFYDFLLLDDGNIYFNLADVSGKGMNAALLMAKTSSLLRCLAKRTRDPGRLLAEVNDELFETASHGMFVTIVTGFIEPATGWIWLANAGHQPPLYHAPDGSFRELPAEAPPLGIVPGVEFPTTTLVLDGGCLYLFTDGVTEATIDGGGRLDVDGLRHLIVSAARLKARERLANIVAEIRASEASQHDDITLMAIECRP
ncbi:MAG: SpoIIE family protein phosphatase [Gammaproteobacteria bacterium]|nr:SpoIIE family protein phosphatase [Gammaproteobacteria bacterium]